MPPSGANTLRDIQRAGRLGAQGATSRLREWRAARERKSLFLPTSATQSGPPRILFLAPDYDIPTGGVRVMYRHVDILNAAGVPAAVWHHQPGFRCSWFRNETEIVYRAQTALGPRDVLVLSELDVDVLVHRQLAVAHVIFNQSGMLTWVRDPQGVSAHYARAETLLRVVTVSDYAAQLLGFAFPERDIRRVHLAIDTELFHPGAAERRIAFMPRRGGQDLELVRNLLARRAPLAGWEFTALHGLPQAEVAQHLRSSAIYLSVGVHEGFGLPAAEAMASGCYVIGFHGYGGREFFLPQFSSPVPTSDVLGLAQAVERAVGAELESPGWLAERGAQAAAFIAQTYRAQRESADVLAAYQDLL